MRSFFGFRTSGLGCFNVGIFVVAMSVRVIWRVAIFDDFFP